MWERGFDIGFTIEPKMYLLTATQHGDFLDWQIEVMDKF